MLYCKNILAKIDIKYQIEQEKKGKKTKTISQSISKSNLSKKSKKSFTEEKFDAAPKKVGSFVLLAEKKPNIASKKIIDSEIYILDKRTTRERPGNIIEEDRQPNIKPKSVSVEIE